MLFEVTSKELKVKQHFKTWSYFDSHFLDKQGYFSPLIERGQIANDWVTCFCGLFRLGGENLAVFSLVVKCYNILEIDSFLWCDGIVGCKARCNGN